MLSKDLLTLRLANQQISHQRFFAAQELVGWMGAMQAQDYAMARWAIGARLPAADNNSVQAAIDKGDIIRTHLMRPTWHFVSAHDAGWIIDLTAPHIRALMKSRLKELELTPRVLLKALKVLDKLLSDGGHRTRDEIIVAWEQNKIATNDQRGAHLLMWAELEKIICSGSLKGKKNTYAHFGTRVTEKKTLARDEGLHRLAQRYFTSHGPATLFDFANWSGLPMADARNAIALVEDVLLTEEIDAKRYWFPDRSQARSNLDQVYCLPAFDEYVIGYKDRSACLLDEHKAVVISINGIFFPIVVFRGKVVGRWKKSPEKDRVKIIHELFPDAPSTRKFQSLLKRASDKASDFLSNERS